MSQRPLRIGIACYPTVGGSGILATELGLALAERGHEIHFLSYAEPARLFAATNVSVHKVSVSAYPLFKYPPYDLALASKMRDLIESRDLDILHVHYAIPHAICAYLAKQMTPNCRTKSIVTLHGTDITVVGSDPAYREVTRFGMDHADVVLAVSEFLAEETRAIFDPQHPIQVLPNFVDAGRFLPNRQLGLTDPLTVVHMSNFRPVKRPLDVVRAFAKIRRRIASRLWLVGDGPDLPSCLDLARDLGVGDAVESLGLVQRVETILPEAHLLLQPSGSESFGLAALEAMSCGVPVVGYAVGGLPEVVRTGQDGFLVPFQDIDALVERSVEILQSKELWGSLRASSRSRAEQEFSVQRSVERHEKVYYDCLSS